MSGLSGSAMSSYATKLTEFLNLLPGWDSYGGVSGNPAVIAAAGSFLRAIIEGRVDLVPLADGGVQIEYHGDGYNVEVEFEPRTKNIEGYWDEADDSPPHASETA